jgi:hypothetical protein
MGQAAEKIVMARKPRRANITIRRTPWDFGASGPANQDGLIIEPRGDLDPETGRVTNPNTRLGARRETWVDRYLRVGKLTVAQASMARWLRDAAEGRGSQDPLQALRIDRQAGGSDPAAAAFDARRAFHRMWALLPAWARPVIERVVLEDRPLRSLCQSGQQEARHLDRLQRGLDELRDAVENGNA